MNPLNHNDYEEDVNRIRAIDLLRHGESAICVFTRGDFLGLDEGATGYWRINPDDVGKVDKVIVYHRDNDINRLFIGDYSHIVPAPAQWPDRYVIFATSSFQETGRTDMNWLGFGNGTQNPAQIIRRE